jgi:hypothetical protein
MKQSVIHIGTIIIELAGEFGDQASLLRLPFIHYTLPEKKKKMTIKEDTVNKSPTINTL